MNISWRKMQQIEEKALYDAVKGLYPTDLVILQDGFEDGTYWTVLGTGLGWSGAQSAAQALQGKYSLLMKTRAAGAALDDVVQAIRSVGLSLAPTNADFVLKASFYIPAGQLALLQDLRLGLLYETGAQVLGAYIQYHRPTGEWGYPDAAWVFTPFADTAANLILMQDTWLSIKFRFNATLGRGILASIGGIEIDISDMDIKVVAVPGMPLCTLDLLLRTSGAAQVQVYFDNIELLAGRLW